MIINITSNNILLYLFIKKHNDVKLIIKLIKIFIYN